MIAGMRAVVIVALLPFTRSCHVVVGMDSSGSDMLVIAIAIILITYYLVLDITIIIEMIECWIYRTIFSLGWLDSFSPQKRREN